MKRKAISHNQFDIDNDTRRMDIINYILNNQGCTRSKLVNGLAARISKKPLLKLVKIMIDENILKEEEVNKKSHILFVNENNLLASVPIELEQFKSAIISLYDKTTEIIAHSLFDAPKIAIDLISQSSEEALSLFLRMVDSIVIRSLIKWPKRIQDKETLKKLYHTVFTQISDMLIDIAEHHEIPRGTLDYSINKLAIQKFGGGGSLFEHWRYFKNYGIQQEVEKVIDALWSIDKEIQQIIYRDLEIVSTEMGLDFKYQSDDWRKLFHALNSLDSRNIQ